MADNVNLAARAQLEVLIGQAAVLDANCTDFAIAGDIGRLREERRELSNAYDLAKTALLAVIVAQGVAIREEEK